MTDAYVHAVADAGAIERAAREIEELDAVSAVHVVTGEHDIIAQISLDDQSELPRVVANDIHSVTGVIDTVTNVAFEP